MKKTIVYSILVIVLWGIVPAFAKMGDLSGGLTTMYVNWFAVLGVLGIMFATGAVKEFKHSQPYFKLGLVGLIWPLGYSIAYFTAIEKGSSSMTTITNYFWPVFYMLIATLFGKKSTKHGWAIVVIASLAVAIPTALQDNIQIAIIPIALGLTAAMAQAIYSLASEGIKANAWLVTFVVELVTAIGSTIYVAVYDSFVLPSIETLGYLAFIGFLANGIGFWAFLQASRESANEDRKTLFLVLMCTTPMAQVVLLPLLGVEDVGIEKWIGVVLITGALLAYRLYPSKQTA